MRIKDLIRLDEKSFHKIINTTPFCTNSLDITEKSKTCDAFIICFDKKYHLYYLDENGSEFGVISNKVLYRLLIKTNAEVDINTQLSLMIAQDKRARQWAFWLTISAMAITLFILVGVLHATLLFVALEIAVALAFEFGVTASVLGLTVFLDANQNVTKYSLLIVGFLMLGFATGALLGSSMSLIGISTSAAIFATLFVIISVLIVYQDYQRKNESLPANEAQIEQDIAEKINGKHPDEVPNITNTVVSLKGNTRMNQCYSLGLFTAERRRIRDEIEELLLGEEESTELQDFTM